MVKNSDTSGKTDKAVMEVEAGTAEGAEDGETEDGNAADSGNAGGNESGGDASDETAAGADTQAVKTKMAAEDVYKRQGHECGIIKTDTGLCLQRFIDIRQISRLYVPGFFIVIRNIIHCKMIDTCHNIEIGIGGLCKFGAQCDSLCICIIVYKLVGI